MSDWTCPRCGLSISRTLDYRNHLTDIVWHLRHCEVPNGLG